MCPAVGARRVVDGATPMIRLQQRLQGAALRREAVNLVLVDGERLMVSFSNAAGPMLWQAVHTGRFRPINELTTNYETVIGAAARQ